MTVSLTQLWLPIVLGAFSCWTASAIIHMLIKYHNADCKPLSNEAEVANAIHQGNNSPGLYFMPHMHDMSEMKNPAMIEKFERGPIAMISVFENGLPPMGKLLIQQLSYFFIGCLFIAYVATLSLSPSAELSLVFRLTLTVSFLSFGFAVIPSSIWLGQPWSNTMRYLIDALIYASLTAAIFTWLWPST